MRRLFGTDGVRGLANRDLSAQLALELATAAASAFADRGEFDGHRPLAVVGRDPRASGEFLESAVVAGLASSGVDVARVGVIPTPAVAHLTAELGADFGVVLSASHNPMPDNGIKFFARGGRKLPDELESAIEELLLEERERPVGAAVGRVRDVDGATERYVDHLLATEPGDLSGLRVVVDCANGSAYRASPDALRRAGADVVTLSCDPDGVNINDNCGSTHLGNLVEAVLAHGADAGIAHDGDADRCLAVAADGTVVDGDQILAVLALSMRDGGKLAAGTVVSTVMANLGFKIAMRDAGIGVVETAVGDRYVLEAMRAGGYNLGGEQSGHIVLLDHATTGDGTLTALHLLGQVTGQGRPLGALAGVVTRMPQVLINVDGVDKRRVEGCAPLQEALFAAQAELGETGRVLLRPSGTEPVVRVMVEAGTAEQAREVAESLAGVVRKYLG